MIRKRFICENRKSGKHHKPPIFTNQEKFEKSLRKGFGLKDDYRYGMISEEVIEATGFATNGVLGVIR